MDYTELAPSETMRIMVKPIELLFDCAWIWTSRGQIDAVMARKPGKRRPAARKED